MLNRKFSIEQCAYITAKAVVETYEEEFHSAEAEYLKKAGIRNQDGTTPTRLWEIEDLAVMEAVGADFDAEEHTRDLFQIREQARNLLKTAENELMCYGMKLIPTKLRCKLEDIAKKSYVTREKIIDLIMSLDASTVPGQAK